MKTFPKADDVLNAIGAWEDSHGNSPESRTEAKLEAARTLGQYVRMQAVLMMLIWPLLDVLAALVRAIF